MTEQTYDVGDPNLKVVQHEFSWGSNTVCTGDPPWDHDQELRHALEAAGWRYAYLIGIVEAEIPEDAAMLASDRSEFAHLVRMHEGSPVWDGKEATTFVCDLTGVDRPVAAAWLNLDWFGGGEV